MLNTEFADGKIEIVASGIRPSHPPEFKIDWQVGIRDFGFVLFHNAVVLEDRNGRRSRPSGTSIFYLPGQPRYYQAINGNMEHTWIIAAGPGIEACVAEYKIPVHCAMELGELDFFETYIHDVRHEKLQLQNHYEDAITDLSRDFFRRLGVLIAESAESLSSSQRRRARMLNEIRLCVHSDISRKWTVKEMAYIESLNPTQFATDYTKQFGISPIDDLIDARLRRAEYLLKHVSLTAKQIAAECGFSSPEHFNRLFHARRGYSPGQFRKL